MCNKNAVEGTCESSCEEIKPLLHDGRGSFCVLLFCECYYWTLIVLRFVAVDKTFLSEEHD